jgi:hypothetical protein
VNPFGDFIILKPKKKKTLARPSRGSRWLAMGLNAVALLSFSQAISLSLLNDKKKEEEEEEEWEERLSARRRNGKKEKKKKKRKKKKIRKKFNVLGCRIILCFFFCYVRCQIVIGGQKLLPLRQDRIEVILE